MGMFSYQLMATGGLLVYMIATWFAVSLLHLQGMTEYMVRTLVAGLGMALWALVLQGRSRKDKAKTAAAGAPAAEAAPEDVELLVRDAEQHLASSRLGPKAKLGSLPVIFLVGESGAAKTSTLIHSGTEPELMSGQVYQGAAVVPTHCANFWFARNTVFTEAGGKMLYDLPRWLNLVRRLRPARLRSLFARGAQPYRAAVVCFDCEQFLRSGAQDTVPVLSRNLRARLGEIADRYGCNLPVYVLFTRTDRMTFFTEYAGGLNDEEASQVLGVTLPVMPPRAGVYAEQQGAALNTAFDELTDALCDKRPLFLSREHDPHKLPGVYQFPREFRKLRPSIVQFLVDVCRPSPLRAGPFLRGFYFSGVRPVLVREEPVAARAARPEREFDADDASKIFSAGVLDPPSPVAEAQEGGTRRVPQWILLGRLFNDVILEDQAALGASAGSTRTERMRRWLVSAGGALCLVLIAGCTVSYFRNRALEGHVLDAAAAVAGAEAAGPEVPLEGLRRLDTLRESLETLVRYQREGAPWSLRWGLYVGDDLYWPVRGVYFRRFHQLLFGSTQDGLLAWLRRLPNAPGPNDLYQPTYDTLKAYLMTTSHHEKSTRLFLSPLLIERWSANRNLDAQRLELARRQFDFYSDELKAANPFSSENDGLAIAHARRYLMLFNAVERIYQFMIAEANRKNPPVNFNRQFPGSAGYVINNIDIAGAFSKDGIAFMADAIKHADRFFGGEEWVLGEQALAALDRSRLEQELWARYRTDLLGRWREYLRNSSIARYASLEDAARKLNQLSGNQSFLMALFCLATGHTAAAPDDLKEAFQPVHYVTPPGCMDRYISGNNATYMQALVSLQGAIEQVSKGGTRSANDPLVLQTIAEAGNARKVTRLVAQSFRVDRESHIEQQVQKLMEDPITQAEGLLGHLGPGQLNAAGKQFCGQFLELTNKYPFNSASKVDATIDELNRILRPGEGLLWTFYENNLKDYLVKQGSQYVVKPDSGVRITPAFAAFFNRAALFTGTIYKDGKDPHLVYTMTALPAQGLQSLTLSLDGQVLKATGKGNESKQFVWPGAATREARLAGSLGGPEFGFLSYDGLWATFRFFADADRFQASGAVYNLDWVPRQGQSAQPMTLASGKALTIPFQLDLGGAPPIFQKGYLAGFQCVSTVAQ